MDKITGKILILILLLIPTVILGVLTGSLNFSLPFTKAIPGKTGKRAVYIQNTRYIRRSIHRGLMPASPSKNLTATSKKKPIKGQKSARKNIKKNTKKAGKKAKKKANKKQKQLRKLVKNLDHPGPHNQMTLNELYREVEKIIHENEDTFRQFFYNHLSNLENHSLKSTLFLANSAIKYSSDPVTEATVILGQNAGDGRNPAPHHPRRFPRQPKISQAIVSGAEKRSLLQIHTIERMYTTVDPDKLTSAQRQRFIRFLVQTGQTTNDRAILRESLKAIRIFSLTPRIHLDAVIQTRNSTDEFALADFRAKDRQNRSIGL